MNQPVRTCRACGCTEEFACTNHVDGSCWWVEDNLCSHCQLTSAALGSAILTANHLNGYMVRLEAHQAVQLQKMTTWLLGLPTSSTIDQIHAGVLALLARQKAVIEEPAIELRMVPMSSHGTVFDPDN